MPVSQDEAVYRAHLLVEQMARALRRQQKRLILDADQMAQNGFNAEALRLAGQSDMIGLWLPLMEDLTLVLPAVFGPEPERALEEIQAQMDAPEEDQTGFRWE